MGFQLHDDVGQRVASLSMEIGLVKRRLAGAPPDLGDALNALQLETVELSRELRELSHELHPGILEHLGLAVVRVEVLDLEERAHS